MQELSSEVHKLRLEVQQYAFQCQDLKQSKDDVLGEMLELQDEHDQLEHKFERLEDVHSQLQSEHDTTQQRNLELQETTNGLTEENQQLSAKLAAIHTAITTERSEERGVGKECVSTYRSRWSPYP